MANQVPILSKIVENNNRLAFTLSGVDKCFANAVRRTILTDIPTVVIRTEDSTVNQCNIKKNTSRLHNEIILQRISCIPIHVNEPEFAEKHILEIDVTNEDADIRMVTTKDIKLKNIKTNQYLSDEEVRKVFPADEISGHYIDIVRLRPRVGNTIPGEQFAMTARFSVGTARINSMFNAVSLCSYGFTIDTPKAIEAWEKVENKHKSTATNAVDLPDQIDHLKKDFFNLDAQRYFVPNSFDFIIQSVGVYRNIYIVHKACSVLNSKFDRFISSLDENIVPILPSSSTRKNGFDSVIESTVEHSYDVILENEDDTLGNILSFMMYEVYFLGDNTLSFCSFKKFHPHDAFGVLRIAYKKNTDKSIISLNLKTVLNMSKSIVANIRKLVK